MKWGPRHTGWALFVSCLCVCVVCSFVRLFVRLFAVRVLAFALAVFCSMCLAFVALAVICLVCLAFVVGSLTRSLSHNLVFVWLMG